MSVAPIHHEGGTWWRIHLYDSTAVVRRAVALLGDRAEEVLDGPRARLGPPWTKDHRTALAATIGAIAGDAPDEIPQWVSPGPGRIADPG